MTKYEYLKNTPLDLAVEEYKQVLKKAGAAYKTEKIATTQALGRVTAAAVYAGRCCPHYCASAMDGIAIMAEKTFGAAENTPVIINPQDYTFIDTGDPIADKYDCVIMVEDIVETTDARIMLHKAAVPWQNIRKIGEDICKGDMIAPSFTIVTPALIGAFLAGGVFSFEAVAVPRIAIIPTGDEIVDASKAELESGDIPEFNSAIFSAMLCEWGAKGIIYPIVADEPGLIYESVEKASRENDAIIVIAGSSAGRDDYTAECLKRLGNLVFHGIAIKPGKPAVLGHIGNVPFIGVPGYPVSGIIVMEEIFKSILSLLTARRYENSPKLRAKLTKQTVSSLKYKEYIRCRVGFLDSTAVAVPMERGAGIVTGFAKASGIFTIPQSSEGKQRGEEVEICIQKPFEELKNSILIVGSHDPLLDEVADILRLKDSKVEVSSSHVGSMGGIIAIKNKEAHMGAIHLLDINSGEYNKSYVRTYFPDKGAVLIRGVGRAQGLMVKKGNPENIKGLKEIAEKKLSYINRQRGSGTRVLLDYLLKKEGISFKSIYGYSREEYTHTAVAAAVAANSAQAGLGILSAAKIYELDFIPLYSEQYDFLVAGSALSDEKVKSFIEVLKSDIFKQRLEKMGGYTFEGIGQIIEIG